LGFITDGSTLAPTPRSRRIELVGDSISAGFGAKGSSSTPNCEVFSIYYTYGWKIAEYFKADLVPIAVSGGQMASNSCGVSEPNIFSMPQQYLQTLASQACVFDWDF